MAYTKKEWNYKTPITPEALNHIEEGIEKNDTNITNLTEDLTNYKQETNQSIEDLKTNKLDAQSYQNNISGGATASMYVKIATVTSGEYEDTNAVFLVNSFGWNNQSGVVFVHSYTNDSDTNHMNIGAIGNISGFIYGVMNIVDDKKQIEIFIKHSQRRFGGFRITCITQSGNVTPSSGNTFQASLPSGTQITA